MKSSHQTSPSKKSAGKSTKTEKVDVEKEKSEATDEANLKKNVGSAEISDEMLCNKKIGTNGTQQGFCRCCNSSNCIEHMRTLLDRDLQQRQLQVIVIKFFL